MGQVFMSDFDNVKQTNISRLENYTMMFKCNV